MLQFSITNIMCGSCMGKIQSKLQENGFPVKHKDLNDASFLVEANRSNIAEIEKLLEEIKYAMDHNSIVVSDKYRIWDDKLLETKKSEALMEYTKSIDADLVGFDDEDIAYIFLCTDEQYDLINEFIESL